MGKLYYQEGFPEPDQGGKNWGIVPGEYVDMTRMPNPLENPWYSDTASPSTVAKGGTTERRDRQALIATKKKPR